MEFLDCALIGVCAVIRSNTVCCGYSLEALLMNTYNMFFCREIRKIKTLFGWKKHLIKSYVNASK